MQSVAKKDIRTQCSPKPWTKTMEATGVPAGYQVFVKMSWPSAALIHSTLEVDMFVSSIEMWCEAGFARGVLEKKEVRFA